MTRNAMQRFCEGKVLLTPSQTNLIFQVGLLNLPPKEEEKLWRYLTLLLAK